MKVCEVCGKEISTRDGDNTCSQCEELEQSRINRISRKRTKSERESVYKLLGLKKVRGAMGGTYWE